MNPTILCIETAADICSIGISRGEEMLIYKETSRSFSHSEVIMLFIEESLKELALKVTDLDAVAIAGGPGSYTALRIGTSTAKGICYAADIPLIAIDTLEILASSIQDQMEDGEIIIPVLDARRKEVYHAVYDKAGANIQVVEPHILTEESYQHLDAFSAIHFVGDAVEKTREIIEIDNAVFHDDIQNSARWMPKLAFTRFKNSDFVDIAYYEPFYYKSPNITTSKKKLL